ncbi:ABC transporter ATP-binding protein [Oceanomicrobium pacificus]|uniref:ATP-binding cassette domain-containing protein n=1 Tax=Oceanomicrobium pacificus TaxID=2692916 RepID=A0A6B0TTN0_9RHOB|nr:ABC transporter ATP-binding protein [Oceanomicrobium pacificus]MXU64323.1 ATP-binding cassette domain-containing protein [Oceanomicrobium pacificus]
MAEIALRDVQKFFGPNQVIKDMNLVIEDGEFIVMLGQSGCGKTTTLRAIAGLETVTEGTITIDGEEVQDRRAADRDIAFVFQSFSLYPHMTVYENIAFPLRAVGMSTEERDREVREVAEVLRITPLLDRRPSALSGGDMQRVAIGRALVRRPKALLMDEPIGALDAKLREEMRAEIKRLHMARNSTSVYVTHDQIEAMSLADRIVIMHDGVLQQIGAPDEVYLRPANLFVAQFVGSPVMNVEPVQLSANGDGAHVHLAGDGTGFHFDEGLLSAVPRDAGRVSLGIRPEAVHLSHEESAGALGGVTTNIEPLGSHDIVDVRIGEARLRARTPAGFVAAEGAPVWVSLDTGEAHFFDNETGLALREAH